MALSDNLISYWSLEAASGTRVDAVVASANDLTDNNTVTGNPGKVANAAQFTAANSEYLSRADNASLSTGDIDFTVACWVYLDTNVNATLITKYNVQTNQDEYLLFYNQNDHSPNNRFSFVVTATGAPAANKVVDATSFGAPSLSTWYFIAAWHDSVGNTINICVNDGTVNSTATTAGVFDGTAPFQIGALIGGAGTNVYYMNGRIDEAGFWKRVLTSAEITQLYNSGNGMSYADITAGGAALGTMRGGKFWGP